MLHGYIPANRFLPYLSWTDIATLENKANTVIVLPTGAIEQHGPHLPCAVDSVISSGVVGHALARLPAAIPAYAIPPITYGKSDEHLHFPGTLTLTGETLLHTILEIGESLYRAGFRKFLMVNGHGGQPQPLQMAARELRLRHGDMIIIMQDTFKVPNCAESFMDDKERQMAMHAGHAETALMLALAPDTVQMDKAVANYPPEFPCPTLSTNKPMAAWASYDFGPSGVIGDPLPSTPEQGAAILDSLAESWAQVITEVHQMTWVMRAEPAWGTGQWQGKVLDHNDAAAFLTPR
ncbi:MULTISPECIES: creatininase family protein [unclassified Enterobacter]|uniref:creatininase family protein n=1 Tax=unclassified Enterobacter TaxID=2608935 RepID=UPI0015CB5EE9|nr:MULTISPECIES: creatininase family protein [unclassified Enterobacter]MBB3307344.1 creatinine amidohydrolase [Enterobacter sp. Sphag1F]NYI16051.1 creatinine amidohydrolase [Enterobacter sp. Sphag71]